MVLKDSVRAGVTRLAVLKTFREAHKENMAKVHTSGRLPMTPGYLSSVLTSRYDLELFIVSNVTRRQQPQEIFLAESTGLENPYVV